MGLVIPVPQVKNRWGEASVDCFSVVVDLLATTADFSGEYSLRPDDEELNFSLTN